MKYPILALLFFIAATVSLHAQNDLPVDLLTGSAKINIPLFQIEDGDMSFPISLCYSEQSIDIRSTCVFISITDNDSSKALSSIKIYEQRSGTPQYGEEFALTRTKITYIEYAV